MPTPGEWRTSIEHAIKMRQAHTLFSSRLIRRYVGNRYRQGMGSDDDNHENAEFQFVANFVPQMVFHNPKVHLTSKVGSAEHDSSTGFNQLALNQWITDIDLASVLTEVAFDMPFDFGVTLLTLQPDEYGTINPDTGKVALKPHIERVSPRRYFADPRRTPGKPPRYEGHLAIHDRGELLDLRDSQGRHIYDPKQIEALPNSKYAMEFWRDLLKDDLIKDLPTDDQVVIAEVFDRSKQEVLSLGYPAAKSNAPGDVGDMRYLRKPRRAFVPKNGPYRIYGIFLVPDQPYPLSPLAASSELVDEINAHAAMASSDAGHAKNMILFDATQRELGEALQYANNGTVNGIPGFNKELFEQIQIGGPSGDTLNWINLLRERLDRYQGFTATDRGHITGATKGEIDRASMASDLRKEFAFNQFRKQVTGLLRDVLWYFENSRAVHFQIDTPDGQEPGQYYFTGGPQNGEQARPVEVYGVQIEAYSMEWTDDFVLQRRSMDMLGVVSRVAAAMPTMPWVHWTEILDDVLDTLNIYNGSKKYIDSDLLERAMLDRARQQEAAGMAVEGQDPGIGRIGPEGASAQLPTPAQVG